MIPAKGAISDGNQSQSETKFNLATRELPTVFNILNFKPCVLSWLLNRGSYFSKPHNFFFNKGHAMHAEAMTFHKGS